MGKKLESPASLSSLSTMAEFFSKGPQSNFTKMSKQFAQEQVMQQAIQDYAEELKEKERWEAEQRHELEMAAAEANKEEEWDFSDDDDISNSIMEARMAQMKLDAGEMMNWKHMGHGELTEIQEEKFLKTVTKSHYAVVHFYHREFPRCKIVDQHLEILAKKYIATKFAKIDAEKAPFFVDKLQVCVMPCVCMFEDGRMMGRIDGFDLLGGQDEFPTEVMECVIGASGVISFKPPEDENVIGIFAKQRQDIVGLNKTTSLDSDSDE